jgi:hypothetical protein
VQLTPHERGSFIFLDEAKILALRQGDVLREALLLKVANGKFIGICEKMEDIASRVIVFHVIHQMRAVAFHLKLKLSMTF